MEWSNSRLDQATALLEVLLLFPCFIFGVEIAFTIKRCASALETLLGGWVGIWVGGVGWPASGSLAPSVGAWAGWSNHHRHPLRPTFHCQAMHVSAKTLYVVDGWAGGGVAGVFTRCPLLLLGLPSDNVPRELQH